MKVLLVCAIFAATTVSVSGDVQTAIDGCPTDGSSPYERCMNTLLGAGIRCCFEDGNECASFCPNGQNDLSTYAEAVETCAANGGRLCTRAEIDSGVCCGTGCNFDSHVNWIDENNDCNPGGSGSICTLRSFQTTTGGGGLYYSDIVLGFQFKLNEGVSSVDVTGLSQWPTNGGLHTMILWDLDRQADLGRVTVDAATYEWTHGELDTPITLTANTTYAVMGRGLGGGERYAYRSSPPTDIEVDSAITYISAALCVECGPNTGDDWGMPTIFNEGATYGFVDFCYDNRVDE